MISRLENKFSGRLIFIVNNLKLLLFQQHRIFFSAIIIARKLCASIQKNLQGGCEYCPSRIVIQFQAGNLPFKANLVLYFSFKRHPIIAL